MEKKPDIVDRIGQLVDEQMAGGEPRAGFDFGDPTYPRCPHCDRHWHGLPLTGVVAYMYLHRWYPSNYVAAEDESPVVCQGSEFIGPMPYDDIPRSRDEVLDQVQREIRDQIGGQLLTSMMEELGMVPFLRMDGLHLPVEALWRADELDRNASLLRSNLRTRRANFVIIVVQLLLVTMPGDSWMKLANAVFIGLGIHFVKRGRKARMELLDERDRARAANE